MILNIRKMVSAKLTERQKVRFRHYRKLLINIRRNTKGYLMRLFCKHKIIDDINAYEQSVYSQNGEDGILAIIFEKIKTTNKYCVEFGIHGNEGNTVYLKEKGWHCLWMDGSGDGEAIKEEFITAENINDLFKKYGVPKEPDLISIDIDYNDYWVLKSIEGHAPRVLVVEYNSSIPPTESKVVEYAPNAVWDNTNYFGARLLAFVKLCKSKGYTLVGCDSKGINAFFVRNDLIKDNFVQRSIEEKYRPPGYGRLVNGKHVGHTQSKRQMKSV